MVISEHEVSQEVLVERLVGRFDQSARQEFKWRIDLAINAGYRHVILNVTEVSFIDSAALVAPQGFVRDILDLTEISEWIPVYSSEEDAIATLQNLPSAERAQSACRDGEE